MVWNVYPIFMTLPSGKSAPVYPKCAGTAPFDNGQECYVCLECGREDWMSDPTDDDYDEGAESEISWWE